MEDFVSVIIPTFNRKELLERSINSVLSQTWPNFELIVVDDGSDDGTASFVHRKYPEVICIFQENRGAAAARNAGIKAARYQLLAFLDSDDCFDKKKLALQVKAMQRQPSCLVSHTQELWYRQGIILNQKKKHRKESGDIFRRSLELCAVGMSTIMARRELFDAVGLFDESLPCCEDYDLWLRVSAGYPFLLVDAPLTIKHGGRPDQLSCQYRVGMDMFRIQAIQKLLEGKTLTREQTTIAKAECIRKCRIYANGCRKHGRNDEGERYSKLAEFYSNELENI
jgi:glycosyltransferase involved in cell wall biosynthesis